MFGVLSFRYNEAENIICLGREFKTIESAKMAANAYALWRGGKYDHFKIYDLDGLIVEPKLFKHATNLSKEKINKILKWYESV